MGHLFQSRYEANAEGNLILNDISPTNHHRNINLARSVTAYFAHYFANYYIKDIAYVFERNAESINRTMHHALTTHLKKPMMKIVMADIENDLSHINHYQP